jgi:hypothetical protein
MLRDFEVTSFKYTLNKILDILDENQFDLEDYETYKKELISFVINKLNFPFTISGLFIEVVLNEFMSKNDFTIFTEYKELYKFCYALDSVIGEEVLHDKVELISSPLIKLIYLSNGFRSVAFEECWKIFYYEYEKAKFDAIENFLNNMFDDFILEFKIYFEGVFKSFNYKNSGIKKIFRSISIKYDLDFERNVNDLLKIITRKSRLLILRVHRDSLYKQMFVCLECVFDDCFKEKKELYDKIDKIRREKVIAKKEGRESDYNRLFLEEQKIRTELRYRYDAELYEHHMKMINHWGMFN